MKIESRVLQNIKWSLGDEVIYFQKGQVISLKKEDLIQYPELFISLAQEKEQEEQIPKEPKVLSSDERHQQMKTRIMEEERIAREQAALFLETEALQRAEFAKHAAARLRMSTKEK